MDILGIGPLELVLILVIALLVFGPDRLPEIGAKLGKGVRELRQLSREISQGVNTITEPLDEIRKPFDDAGQIVGQVSDTAQSLRNPGLALQNAVNQQLTTASAEPAAAVVTAAENTIAPPRAPEPVETVAQLTTAASDEAPTIEPAAPVTQPSAAPAVDGAVDTRDAAEDHTTAPPRLPEPVESTAPAAQPSDASAPTGAVDTPNVVPADAMADPPATESSSPAAEP